MISQREQFVFDEAAAENAVEFFRDCLVHVQGPLAGEEFTLQPWQIEIVRDLFGWKDQTGCRQYQTAYIEIPRKNGKTTLLAGLGLYLLLQGEIGGQVFGCASSLEQATFLFDIAAAMVRGGPKFLQRKFDVKDSRKRIIYRDKNAYYRAIPGDADKAHGSRPTAVLFDELHKQKTRHLWDAMKTGMGTSINSLFLSITTAGYDRSSICWEQHQYARKVLDGVIDDPHFYPVIYAADDGDDWKEESTWEKANPSLDISIPRSFLRQECEVAKVTPSYENTFRNLYLNQWTGQSERWIPMDDWDACKAGLTEEDLIGLPCWAGLDLASTRDVTALVLVFDLGSDTYGVKPWFWIPEKPRDVRAQQDRTQVVNWATTGYVKRLPGDVIDYELLAADVAGVLDKFDVRCLAVDPWGNAQAVQQRLQSDHGWPVEKINEFRQGPANYSPVMNDMERRLVLRKIQHDGNPVLRWMADNVAAKADANGNLRPDKENSGDKIDGIVAMLMGLALALFDAETDCQYQPGMMSL